MSEKEYLPSNKEDLSFVRKLYEIQDIEIIKEDIPILLEWLQDFNWEQADIICDYLLQFPLKTFRTELENILDSNDDMWKYWILLRLIKPTINKTDNWIIPKIRLIAYSPSEGEIESEVNEIAQEIILEIENQV